MRDEGVGEFDDGLLDHHTSVAAPTLDAQATPPEHYLSLCLCSGFTNVAPLGTEAGV